MVWNPLGPTVPVVEDTNRCIYEHDKGSSGGPKSFGNSVNLLTANDSICYRSLSDRQGKKQLDDAADDAENVKANLSKRSTPKSFG